MTLLRIALSVLVIALAALVAIGLLADEERPEREFFGIGPQTPLTEADAERMRAGGIGSVRWPVAWSGVQPSPDGGYEWAPIDEVVETAARAELRLLPFIYSTPEWLADDWTTLPVAEQRQRRAWTDFLRAAVERYGPGGEFWRERRRGPGESPPEVPLRAWQIWNEANFEYFADPVSPSAYGRLLASSAEAIRSVDPGAEVVASGLFGRPPEGMPGAEFLDRLYAVEGVRGSFDAAALHAYAKDVETLEELAGELRQTLVDNGDAGAKLYITEVGWGSEADSDVSFEVGPEGQAEELRAAYDYLIENRDDLNLESVYWFSWKDVQGACDFCDSVGLFEEGEGFDPKPAWDAFVEVSGGEAGG